MSDRIERVTPDSQHETLFEGDQLIGSTEDGEKFALEAGADEDRPNMFLIKGEHKGKELKAWFRRNRESHLDINMVPDMVEGEEGRNFNKLFAGLAAAAATGASVYLIIKRRKHGE